MGLMQGNVTLRRFLAQGPEPDEEKLGAGLEQHRFRPFEDGEEEERFGWVDWRNPLISPADPNWTSQGRFSVFALRIDSRKVPPMLLKAHTDLRLQKLMKEKDLAFVGREARISIQDEVKAELLRKVLPTPKIADVAWDIKGGLLWTTASNSKALGHLTSLMIKSFGIELLPLAPLMMASGLAPGIPVGDIAALDPYGLGGEGA